MTIIGEPVDYKNVDIHVVTQVLKGFLKELPGLQFNELIELKEPVITYHLCNDFLKAKGNLRIPVMHRVKRNLSNSS